MKRARPSELELQVLSVLWDRGPSSVRAILEFVAEHNLVGNVDPVQYSIRLLVPQGSLLPGGWNDGWARPMLGDDLGAGGVGPGPVQWVGDGDAMDTWQAEPDLIEPAIPAPGPVEEEA